MDCAAIDSPGLSSAPAIGAMVADIVRDSLHLKENPAFDPTRKGILDPKPLDFAARAELIKQNPAYGQIICLSLIHICSLILGFGVACTG